MAIIPALGISLTRCYEKEARRRADSLGLSAECKWHVYAYALAYLFSDR